MGQKRGSWIQLSRLQVNPKALPLEAGRDRRVNLTPISTEGFKPGEPLAQCCADKKESHAKAQRREWEKSVLAAGREI
jgi:hypothetical protein